MKKLLLLPFLLSICSIYAQTNWQTISSGTNIDLLSISFGNEQIGYISGKDGILLKTIDSGVTWNPINHSGLVSSPLASDIIDIQFIDADNGYAILSAYPIQQYQGQLFETSDGGQTWLPSNDSVNIAASRCYFFEKGNGFLLGSAFFAGNVISKMEQGLWTNYDNFSFDPSYFNYGIAFSNPLVGIIGGDNGFFHRTFDGGQNWDSIYSGSDSTIYDIKYLNESTIIAATAHGNRSLIISHDSGASWTDEVNSFTFAYPIMEALIVAAGDSIIAVGHTTNENVTTLGLNGFIYWFNGSIWSYEAFPNALHDVSKQSSKVAFSVGDSGLILTNRPLPNSISNFDVKQKARITFPNPAKNNLNLEYDELIIQELSMMDISGKIIKHYKPQLKVLDISALAKGVYFLIINAQHEQIIEKIILE